MHNNHYSKWLQQFKIYMRNLLNYPRLCVLLASILFKSFCLQHISLVALLRLASFPSPPFAKSAINFIANHFLAAFLGHFANMMFSLVAPLLLLLPPDVVDAFVCCYCWWKYIQFIICYRAGGRQTEKGQSDAYFLLTQRAELGHASHGVVKWQLPSSTPTCVSVLG